jgi:hypothetical protein
MIYVPLFCLFCILMVYNDYVNRRREPLVKIVVITSEAMHVVKNNEDSYGAKKQFAKKNK